MSAIGSVIYLQVYNALFIASGWPWLSFAVMVLIDICMLCFLLAMIIGGGQIYAETLKDADVIELTEVHTRIDGDTVFPALEEGAWVESGRALHPPETPDGPEFSFVTLTRR